MKKSNLLKIICGLLAAMMLLICFAPMAFAEVEEPDVEANNVMLVSLNTGATIYKKNPDERIHPASTTKLMTMAVAMDLIKDLDETIVFDKDASYADLVIGSSNMGLKDGEIISLNDLMYGIAVSSANEGTNAVAIHLCGSIEAFVQKMNAQAKAWGMKNTHFVNTHGLTDENHYTTASDMAILAQKVFADSRLMPYLSASSYTLPESNMNPSRTLITTNQLMRMNSGNYYKYCEAGKTGTTSAAGYNLISVAKYKGMEYIVVAMNASYTENATNPIFEDSITLYKWAFNNYSIRTLLPENISVYEIPVALCAKSDYVMLVPKEKLEAVVADGADVEDREKFVWQVETEYNAENPAHAPIKTGDVLGKVTIVEKDEAGNVLANYGSMELVAGSDLERSAILYYLHLIKTFFSNIIVRIISVVIILAIIAYIIFMIWQNNTRRRRRIARRIRF